MALIDALYNAARVGCGQCVVEKLVI